MQEEQNIREDVGGLNDSNQVVDYNQYYSRPPLSKGQKIAVAVLAFFSFFIIIAWMIQFKQGISAPLSGSSTVTNSNPVTTDTEVPATVNMTKDTDGDGLTDYNELNTYKTSPYLEDSDSDGFSDKVEIDSGKDPNCPTGAICNAVGTDTIASTTINGVQSNNPLLNSVGQEANQSGGSQPILNLSASSTDTIDAQKVLAGQADAASLRKMLLQAGMDPTVLEKISDEDLMNNYKQTLNK
ncbi:hypothetical protein L6270_02480 [Candidatus Parcubacteria bacterium]|nr:hypothetical protein [Patescibacteria group bacterium]MBU4309524.1 hypothetical protein [Patescibacteria group bacterium]MBU4577230.1 hypothetical protein [Patescibacteria group bacterium]MCG2696876.1 hypothetical protein [Candidatus Parcubacteria bacterium]